MEEEDQQQELDREQDHDSFKAASDICQQLLDRYAKSSAPQHRHLLATAAAMRSIIASESLPLTPPAYFAAIISAIDDVSSSSTSQSTLDPAAVAALLSFLAIVLPLLAPQEIAAPKANEAVMVLVRLLEREKKVLAVSTVRAAVKCLGILVGFCDLGDWSSVKLGFDTLLEFSVDKRPKVRRCSQDCLQNIFKSIQCSTVKKEASKLVLSMLKNYMPSAVEINNLSASVGPEDDRQSKPKNLEVLHRLNVISLIVPFLSGKVASRVLSEVNKLMVSQFSKLTRHILKTVEACFETSKVELIAPAAENIVVSLLSYVSFRKNPSDTVMYATTLLKRTLNTLHAAKSSSYIKSLPPVCDAIAGLLTSEADTASHASVILKELVSLHVSERGLSIHDSQSSEDGLENKEASAIKSICATFENFLCTSDGKPNEHTLAVISTLFIKLGGTSYCYMESILLKLADLMTLAIQEQSDTHQLQNAIGSAIVAMGPERILTLVPVSVNADDLTCSNIWLVPILKRYMNGASLRYYIEHIMPLAKSFKRASRKAKGTAISQDLLAHANDLWGLLPAFSHYPIDLNESFGPLADILIKFLKEDPFMHENVAVALQVLVNQNKSVLNQAMSVIESSNLPAYSKKSATRNIKALASHSNELLQALIDLFIDSPAGKRSQLKDAIGCLASISDSSITKNILGLLLERFQFNSFRSENLESQSVSAQESENVNTMKQDSQRSVMLEVASFLVVGANEDLIDTIFNFVKYSFQVTDGIGHCESYYTLSRILEEHTWFCSSRYVEVVDLLLSLKSPIDTANLRNRFACFCSLLVHALKVNSELEDAKAFLILNEIIVTLKDVKEEEVRKVAYDTLLEISSSLRDSSGVSSDEPFQKLISMIMGYLSGASPHIKSGAISALSVLIYKDTDVCLSVPELVPSLLALLKGRSTEIVKAVLGFVKVIVSCLQAKDLHNLLSDIATSVLPWSSVSRNHFRSKVVIIVEILIRKCGVSAVQFVSPEKYKGFIKSVVENRRSTNKTNSNAADDSKTRPEKRKWKETDSVPQKNELMENGKRRKTKKHSASIPPKNEPNKFHGRGDTVKRASSDRRFSKEKIFKDQPTGIIMTNKKSSNGPPTNHQIERTKQPRKMK